MPLYQLGWLGDDTLDAPTDFSIDSMPYNTDPGFVTGDAGFVPYAGVMTDPTLVPSQGTYDQWLSQSTPGIATSLAQAIANFFKGGRTLSPSPRVSSTPLSQQTLSMGSALPMLAIGAIGLVVLTSIGRRR